MTKESPKINVSVTFRHTESTEALKSYAGEKIEHCLSKYLSGDVDAQVILSVEKRDHSAEVRVRSKLYDLSAGSTTEDLYSAIDKVIDTLESQIRKQKEKQTAHKVAPAPF